MEEQARKKSRELAQKLLQNRATRTSKEEGPGEVEPLIAKSISNDKNTVNYGGLSETNEGQFGADDLEMAR